MNKLKLSFNLLFANLKSLFLFEIIYKALTVLVFTPVLLALFSLSMRIAGVEYLAESNFVSYLLNPFVVVILLLIILGAALVTIIEISALIYCFHGSYHQEKIGVLEMFQAGLHNIKYFFQHKSILIIVYMLGIIPILNLGVQIGFISSLELPEFILDFIFNNTLLCFIFLIIVTIMAFYALNWLFSLHYYTLGGMSYKEARMKSRQTMKGKWLSTLWSLAIWNLLTSILIFLSFFIVVEIIVLLAKLLAGALALQAAYLVGKTAIVLIYTLSLFLAVPLAFALLSGLFYEYRAKKGEPAPPFVRLPVMIPQKKSRRIFNRVVLSILAVNALIFTLVGALDKFDRVHLDKPEVQAHRGDSVRAPENTMPAFLAAIEDGADWIELDVHQTADGVIVVTHDADLKRIAGVNKQVWEVSYSELESYDVGSWFDPKFSYVRVSTLEEVIEQAQGKIKLNIELKPTGHEKQFEEQVVQIVKKHDFAADCVLASLNYECLENIKQIDPQMPTLYIMAMAIGDLTVFTAADHFSLEASFITKSLLAKLHTQGHKVYAWTVNTEKGMEAMLDLGVDAIITDNPVKAKEFIGSEGVSDLFQKFIEMQI